MDLYNYEYIQRLPYVQPTDWQAAPLHAPAFNTYICNATQLGATSLDTYVAPQIARGTQYYSANGLQGNGSVVYGNAPTSGIYTGIQQE
jgi:hypothetical protein